MDYPYPLDPGESNNIDMYTQGEAIRSLTSEGQEPMDIDLTNLEQIGAGCCARCCGGCRCDCSGCICRVNRAVNDENGAHYSGQGGYSQPPDPINIIINGMGSLHTVDSRYKDSSLYSHSIEAHKPTALTADNVGLHDADLEHHHYRTAYVRKYLEEVDQELGLRFLSQVEDNRYHPTGDVEAESLDLSQHVEPNLSSGQQSIFNEFNSCFSRASPSASVVLQGLRYNHPARSHLVQPLRLVPDCRHGCYVSR